MQNIALMPPFRKTCVSGSPLRILNLYAKNDGKYMYTNNTDIEVNFHPDYKTRIFWNGSVLIDIESHVHVLQNLYFSLTGEELELQRGITIEYHPN